MRSSLTVRKNTIAKCWRPAGSKMVTQAIVTTVNVGERNYRGSGITYLEGGDD